MHKKIGYVVRVTGGVRRTRGCRSLGEEVGTGGFLDVDEGGRLFTVFGFDGGFLTAFVALAMPDFISVELYSMVIWRPPVMTTTVVFI